MADFLDKILQESDEMHYGFEPLLKEFMWFKPGDPEKLKSREEKLKGYYTSIYRKTGSAKTAYLRTKEWAKGIFT